MLELEVGVCINVGSDCVGLYTYLGRKLSGVSIIVYAVTEGEDLTIGVSIGYVLGRGVNKNNLCNS